MCVVPGHGHVKIPLRLRGKGAAQLRDGAAHLARSRSHVHAEFGRDHFVAAAAGMKLRAERPELFNQRCFGEVVDVLGCRAIEPGGIGKRTVPDFIESR